MIGGADAFLALALVEDGLVLAVTPGVPSADRLADDLRTIGETMGLKRPTLLEFPPLLDGDRSALGTRLKTIAALRAYELRPYPAIVVASYPALASSIPARGVEPLVLDLKSDCKFSALVERLAKAGYGRVPQVCEEGEFSVRGGIVDAWSPGEEFPVRGEFFGDDLESLRSFDPATQISIERIERAILLPAKDESTDERTTLLDILPKSATILELEHNSYNLEAKTRRVVYTGDPAPRGVATYDFVVSPLPGFAELGANESHHPEIFEAAKKRLEEHLAQAKKRGETVVEMDALSGGFEVGKLVVVSKADRVFVKKAVHHADRRVRGARLSDFDDLEPGEYVVHVDYGVGRYTGSSEILLDGKRSEVFTIEYADGGILHVPAAHAHLLSRYVGVNGEAVRLHRLDGKRWARDKQNAQKAVCDLAAALLETQAKRETIPGFAYDVECEGMDAFEAAFPYEETADQTSAIAAIKEDLGKSKPMDRLVCGDAGYGKTEVAMRAAYIAALNSKQVAVLAPTTVLAEQHFETFTSRFDGTPVRIEAVSRFQSPLTRRGTFKRVESGACDIVIGTHAILSEKLRFHDLGLVIVDEEQRFGVRHKEFLKRLRATADVLTLSATPIPRTLYLSMTGARDLSLLRSPPRERVAVETRIVRASTEIIKTAVESEILRGGQVYFLHNRVATIAKVEKELHALLPKARIVVAHGQMDAKTLAKKMREFERGDYDILLSTTIIESGIDIPRANTILVDHADQFGMADLYQLRGRVGRSAKQGYAYFLLPPSGIVDEEARERLAALKRHGGLGSGFNLAVRDLELRGAGNLLGSQQSGHIAAVGFGLYCQLLKRTIALFKGEKVEEIVDVKLNLDFASPRLPYDYVEEDVQRLSLMKRFAEAQDMKTLRAVETEMRDRFGPPPPEAREFVRVAELRVECALSGIDRIDAKNDRAVLYRVGSRKIDEVVDLKPGSPESKLTELLRLLRRHRTPKR